MLQQYFANGNVHITQEKDTNQNEDNIQQHTWGGKLFVVVVSFNALHSQQAEQFYLSSGAMGKCLNAAPAFWCSLP